MKRTLIIERREPAKLNTVLTGVMLDISFARCIPWMAAFNEERVLLRPLCLGNFVAIAEGGGS